MSKRYSIIDATMQLIGENINKGFITICNILKHFAQTLRSYIYFRYVCWDQIKRDN